MAKFTCMISLGLAMTLGACQSSPEQPRNAATSAAAIDPSAQRGRQLYQQRCTRCHAAEPIHGYSRQQWLEILPRMTRLSRLSDQQSADVTAYVMQQLP